MYTSKELFEKIKEKSLDTSVDPHQRLGYIQSLAEHGFRQEVVKEFSERKAKLADTENTEKA